MVRVAGSSQYLNQARLAQATGSNFDAGNILGLSSSSSLLDAGRGNAVGGIGISARARALTSSQLQSSAATGNQLFSLSGGGSATVEAATIQIAGLRATVPASRDVIVQDDGSISSAGIGSELDIEA